MNPSTPHQDDEQPRSADDHGEHLLPRFYEEAVTEDTQGFPVIEDEGVVPGEMPLIPESSG